MNFDDVARQVRREEDEQLPNKSEITKGSSIEAAQPESQSEPISSIAAQDTNSHRRHKKANPWVSLPILVVSFCLWLFSVSRLTNTHLLLSGATALAALALSSFVLRGPRLRNGYIISGLAAALFTIELIHIGRATLVVISNSYAPVLLLEATLMGFIGVGIAVCLLVTWIRKWRYAESFAVGIVAIFLSALCLPVLQTLTKTLQYPNVNGTAVLYVADVGARQGVTLDVTTNPLGAFPKTQSLTIETASLPSIRWALLLTGDARLHNSSAMTVTNSAGTGETFNELGQARNLLLYDLMVDGAKGAVWSPVPAQLFSGTVNSRELAVIGGQSYGTFISTTSDRTAVSLPTYTEGFLVKSASGERWGNEYLTQDVVKLIVNSLGGQWPTTGRVPNLALNIQGGDLQPMQSVTQSNPAMTTINGTPNTQTIFWKVYSSISPSYILVNQDAVDEVNNTLFVFAILLGVAGAGILGSLQGIIHSILSRNASGNAYHNSTESPPRE